MPRVYSWRKAWLHVLHVHYVPWPPSSRLLSCKIIFAQQVLYSEFLPTPFSFTGLAITPYYHANLRTDCSQQVRYVTRLICFFWIRSLIICSVTNSSKIKTINVRHTSKESHLSPDVSLMAQSSIVTVWLRSRKKLLFFCSYLQNGPISRAEPKENTIEKQEMNWKGHLAFYNNKPNQYCTAYFVNLTEKLFLSSDCLFLKRQRQAELAAGNEVY